MIDQNMILCAGFSPPPPTAYTKKDPRGTEYGSFEITVHTAPGKDYWELPALTVKEIIRLRKLDGNGLHLYTMYFNTPDSFAAWAKEET